MTTTWATRINDFLAQPRIAVAASRATTAIPGRQPDLSPAQEGWARGHTCFRCMLKLTGGLPA